MQPSIQGPEARRTPRRNSWLRQTLATSRKEAVASAVMTATCDNYLGAFAVTLRASLLQMGWLSALPQLSGAAAQLLSVWLSPYFARRLVILCWFIPHLKELRVREHPLVMQIIYRISRSTPGAGVVLDWLTVSRKKRP